MKSFLLLIAATSINAFATLPPTRILLSSSSSLYLLDAIADGLFEAAEEANADEFMPQITEKLSY